MIEIECPICGTEFDAIEWDDGECPNCGNIYGWGEMCNDDYSDCYPFVDWDYYSEEDVSKGKDCNFRLMELVMDCNGDMVSLFAELCAIEQMLKDIPLGNVIERVGLEERRDELKRAIDILNN